MRNKVLLLLAALIPLLAFSQDKENNDFGIKFTGFVKNDFFYDSRQTVDVREGHFLLYPKEVSNDLDGNDINASPSFNFLSIQTRLTGTITGPDAFGAKTSGLIEGAFFGHTDADINGFRLRHAIIKLRWEKSELLLGQTWHAMFITDCFPDVVSFNTGAPFQPFSRNPQVKYTYFMGNLSLIATAMSQRDFASIGPATTVGTTSVSSKYLRNAGIPDINLKVQYNKSDKEKGTQFVAGAGGDYKVLRPRLVSDAKYKTDQTISGLSAIAFMKIKIPKLTVKLEGVYGQNMYDATMLGGYAFAFTDDTNIIKKDLLEYTSLDVISFWTDIHSNGTKFKAGIFAGFTKNMGSLNNIMGYGIDSKYYLSRGSNIDYIYRISPRVEFNSGKTRFSTELEYTVAAYGKITENNSLGQVSNAEEVSNLRLLIGAYYFF